MTEAGGEGRRSGVRPGCTRKRTDGLDRCLTRPRVRRVPRARVPPPVFWRQIPCFLWITGWVSPQNRQNNEVARRIVIWKELRDLQAGLGCFRRMDCLYCAREMEIIRKGLAAQAGALQAWGSWLSWIALANSKRTTARLRKPVSGKFDSGDLIGRCRLLPDWRPYNRDRRFPLIGALLTIFPRQLCAKLIQLGEQHFNISFSDSKQNSLVVENGISCRFGLRE